MENALEKSYKEALKELRNNLSTMLPAEALETWNNDAKELQRKHSSILKLKVGDLAPDFVLPNAVNKQVSLSEVLKSQKVVLTFYRGTWCPYCNLALNLYQSILPQIQEAGATMIAISPQTPDESLNIKQKNELQYHVLSDTSNKVAKQFTTVHPNPEKSLEKMTELGYDFDSFYSEEGSELPIPAVFIIEQNGEVSFAKSEGGDYRYRVEPSELLEALNNK
ncbi:peroxiredoxin-like family protein [Reichenbachiella versicolor]|uniref:peroxiredoxin-like family protein n=1 Tax=Reichenbachiella versicolor TaxID=1821036 RepID=UPI000D6E39FF|nr:peroxiredoxin-like family protein [Reichenbachiella versicolor]